jgi:hypothetical protein
VIDMSALQMWLAVLIGWLDRQEREALAYVIEENRVLRAQLAGRRLCLTNDDRRRLAVRAFGLAARLPTSRARRRTILNSNHWPELEAAS